MGRSPLVLSETTANTAPASSGMTSERMANIAHPPRRRRVSTRLAASAMGMVVAVLPAACSKPASGEGGHAAHAAPVAATSSGGPEGDSQTAIATSPNKDDTTLFIEQMIQGQIAGMGSRTYAMYADARSSTYSNSVTRELPADDDSAGGVELGFSLHDPNTSDIFQYDFKARYFDVSQAALTADDRLNVEGFEMTVGINSKIVYHSSAKISRDRKAVDFETDALAGGTGPMWEVGYSTEGTRYGQPITTEAELTAALAQINSAMDAGRYHTPLPDSVFQDPVS